MKNEDKLYSTFLTSIVLICFLIIVSSTVLAANGEIVSNSDSHSNSLFPYPRGTAPAYGMMGWETGTQFLKDNATLVHLGWKTSITPQEFVDNVNKGKQLGISKY